MVYFYEKFDLKEELANIKISVMQKYSSNFKGCIPHKMSACNYELQREALKMFTDDEKWGK